MLKDLSMSHLVNIILEHEFNIIHDIARNDNYDFETITKIHDRAKVKIHPNNIVKYYSVGYHNDMISNEFARKITIIVI